MSLELPLALYQVVLYTVLFVGIGALGAGVGYIVSYLVHERRASRGETEGELARREEAPSHHKASPHTPEEP